MRDDLEKVLTSEFPLMRRRLSAKEQKGKLRADLEVDAILG